VDSPAALSSANTYTQQGSRTVKDTGTGYTPCLSASKGEGTSFQLPHTAQHKATC
jgi:hypothetical protein